MPEIKMIALYYKNTYIINNLRNKKIKNIVILLNYKGG